MDRATRERRTSRRMMISLFAASALVVGIAASSAGAEVPGPNGQIVFSRFNADTGTSDVFVANPDGTNAHMVPQRFPVESEGGAFWSPNGTKLLITNTRRLDRHGDFLPFRPATVDPDGSHYKLLDTPGAPFDMFCDAWSPDGTRILCGFGEGFGGGAPGVFSIRSSDGGNPVRLSTNPFGAIDVPGDYSPDGTRIVFMRTKLGSGPNPDRAEKGAVFVANADGTDPRQITPYGLARAEAFAHWSPDGTTILFGSAIGGLFVLHPDGTGMRPIVLDIDSGTYSAFSPGWSPDGTRIVFSLFLLKTEQEDIYTAKADGTNLVQVTDTPSFEPFADWGPHPLAP